MKISIKLLLVIYPLCFSLLSCSHGSSHHEVPITGEVTQEHLLSSSQVFQKNVNNHYISPSDKALIAQWPSDLHIDIFFGTWCHDSQREVPRILSILNENKEISSTLVALDIDKSDPKELGKRYQVKYTPTLIIKVGDKEIGRVIERPTQSLIKDITGFLEKHTH